MTTAKESYEKLSEAINNFGFNKTEFMKCYRKDHRALQASIFELAINIIEETAKDDYQYDGRNEYCHKRAKEIVEKFPNYFYIGQ